MYGTKSSVTLVKGSSSTISSSDWVLVRWRTSSKIIILRWPPDRPAVNAPPIVPPILMFGLYDAFLPPLPPSSVSSEYSFQKGRCEGSNAGI
eukprot:scaffold73853_cov50-Phaeocystis_antarctica.AAC.5